MFCPVVGRGAFSADDSQEAVLDFFTLLIHYQGVPVAVFVRGFARWQVSVSLDSPFLRKNASSSLSFLMSVPSSQKQMNGASNASVSAPASLLYT